MNQHPFTHRVLFVYFRQCTSYKLYSQFSLYVMDDGNKQIVAINFCFKDSLSATETLVLVQKACGNEVLNRSNIFRRYSWFRDGRELVEDAERGDLPKSTRTEVNIVALADLVKNIIYMYNITQW